MLFNGILAYVMVYLVLEGGGGSFLTWIGISTLAFFTIPVVVMIGYTVSVN